MTLQNPACRFAIRNLRRVRIGRIRVIFDLALDGVLVKGCRVVADEKGRPAFVSPPRISIASGGGYASNVFFRRAFAIELFATVCGLLEADKPP